MKKLTWLLVATLCLGLVAAQAATAAPAPATPIITVPGESVPGAFDRGEYLRRQQALQRWLLSERVPGAQHNPIVIEVTRDEMRRRALGECEECDGVARKVRVGIVKEVDAAVDFTDLAPELLGERASLRLHGAIRATVDGGYVWSATATSPEAKALRVRFSDFFLPPDTELYVYNESGQAFGPYTWAGPNGDGDFWSNTVAGDVVTIQLRHLGPTAPRDLKAVSFTVSGIGHIDPDAFREPTAAAPQAGFPSNCGTASCVEDASCHNSQAVADARYAIGHMQWVSGAWIYICTGGLIADSDPGTQVPYFLSANHCISKSKDAKSLEVYWQFWTSSCGGACYDPDGNVPRTSGATVTASNRSGDYTLMQLKQTPPAGSRFLGWTNDPVAFTNNATLYRISHPNGAPQAYSEHRVDTSAGTCSSWPRGGWIYSRDVVGATMGGSSGSPVLNGSGLIVGQLSGACGTNLNDDCDSVNNATVDGAFASYYDQVAPYLGGGTGNNPPTATFTYNCSGLTCDFDGSGSSDSDGTIVSYDWTFGDGGTASGALVSHSYGADGTYTVTLTVTDNEAATGQDSQNVNVGGGQCLPGGSSCNANGECCSGKCKGKPGSKTCR